MELREEDIKVLVQEILKRVDSRAPGAAMSPAHSPESSSYHPGTPAHHASRERVVFSSVPEAVQAAKAAQKIFQEIGLEKRKAIVESMRKAGQDHAERLARLAHEETGMGRWEDKLKKNILVALKTPGVEDLQPVQAYTGDQGLTLVELAPFGAVAAVTPSTNPTSTITNNSISILSAGNAVVFAPHPAAARCCQETMRVLDEAIARAGGPHGLITSFEPVSQENTMALLKNPQIDMAMVTGGPGIVKAAMAVGIPRKIICAGPGNPPVIVDETADFMKAARGIVDGASFDNCVLCTGEKEVIVTEAAAEKLLAEMRKDPRGYELSRAQMDDLAGKVFRLEGGEQEPVLNREYVGKNADWIARAIGLSLPDSIRLLWGEVPQDHPFIWIEQLMPVLPVTRAATVEKAVALAVQAEGGNHHTASIYSMHVGHITQAARALKCSIFVKNGPNYMGLGMGEGFATMSIGTPTGDGLTKPSHFSRPLHCSMVGYLRIV